MDMPKMKIEGIALGVALTAMQIARDRDRPQWVPLHEWLSRVFEELDPGNWPGVMIDPKRIAEGWFRVREATRKALDKLMAAVEK